MAVKASDRVKFYKNKNGVTIGSCDRKVFEVDGLYFKDIDGSGEFKDFDDWRNSPLQRAQSYVKVLNTDEKIGLLFASDWRMGLDQEDKTKLDESGVLDEGELVNAKTIFGIQNLPSTTVAINEWFVRHLIFRKNPSPKDLVDWVNQLNAKAEECEHFVPVEIISNSRNENGETIFGMNDATGVFVTWPGTLGIAAIARGEGLGVIEEFANTVRKEWDATGIKKGYMYMADVLTDPRWQRSYGTFGEDPKLIKDIFEKLVPLVQGSDKGVSADGVAMTVKHFPGGGARENGFDPHYKAGQWNVYATENSLRDYHLPAFESAIAKNISSIMPYYAKPASDKSAIQKDLSGNDVEMKPLGFAYNDYFIKKLLKEQLGFKGYINSDTGIVHNMCWGVEALDTAERIAFAINNGEVDLISGLFDLKETKEAVERASNDYYESHDIPKGFKKADITLSEAALDKAITRTLTEMFALGIFDNPYRDPKAAKDIINDKKDREVAELAHRKSVVLLKNDGTLPLKKSEKVYIECFNKNAEQAKERTEKLRKLFCDRLNIVEDFEDADIAILLVNPTSGEYFSATKGYLELDICEGKTVCNVSEDGLPLDETHEETTVANAKRIKDISDTIHKNGGKVVGNINISLPWLLGEFEPYVDALCAGFDTYDEAVLDVISGEFSPVAKLPLTLPRGDEVIAVNKDGVCVSPNDVPGYDKDKYMPESMKDENGKAYAYRDSVGNYYELGFGLRL
ncbi:MAG: glycoside hydrolase family 3 protein [Lachnospiraceae bacterium oral taxon 082]|nr:glycoside hydrolase family 3 protein [Lachnospiraceae bacterium oral taxon 082]